LQQAGIVHGDLLAVRLLSRPEPPAAARSGGLDFSTLLASATTPAAATSSSTAAAAPPPPVYYPGMPLDDAISHNPHPQQFVSLLQQHESLFKELNHHQPRLAARLKNKSLADATAIWREELVKGGIRTAIQRTELYHKDESFKQRLAVNPNDEEAKAYFETQKNQSEVMSQYYQVMNEYPESMGRVLMLYIAARVNGHDIQAFVDSGAQSTIMSKRRAQECGILHLVDRRFAGIAVGVGTGKILGRIHLVSLQIGPSHFFPCTVTVMDEEGMGDKNMDFLLGLDMLKRHLCQIDLEHACLKFQLAPGKYMEAPFLHEKDLDESKGGTKGFDPNKANEKLLKEDDDTNKMEGG
jgi:DNA damage-inducible protein 1